MISRAGSNGSRRRHGSLSGTRGTVGRIERVILGRVVVLMASAVPRWRSSALGGLGGDALAVLDRSVDRRPPGDHRGELLGASVADILELRDADVLDAREPRSLGGAGVADRGGRDRVERRLGERLGRLLVLRDLVGRLPGAGR